MSSDQLPSAAVLRTSLTALNLPIWGSREQMWERLKNGGEKKKPGPKPGKKNKDTSGGGTLSTTSFFEPGELKFYNAERPKLLALGISDQIKLTTELKRRWEESKTKTTSKKDTSGSGAKPAKETNDEMPKPKTSVETMLMDENASAAVSKFSPLACSSSLERRRSPLSRHLVRRRSPLSRPHM